MDGRQHFGVQIPQKTVKIAFYKHARASANGLKTNDVIEDWLHWLAVARRPSSVYYSQHLGNYCGCVFYNINVQNRSLYAS